MQHLLQHKKYISKLISKYNLYMYSNVNVFSPDVLIGDTNKITTLIYIRYLWN